MRQAAASRVQVSDSAEPVGAGLNSKKAESANTSSEHPALFPNERSGKSGAGWFALLFLSAVCLLYYFSSHSLSEALREQKLQLFKTLFVSLILEALPFILIGVLVSSILHVFVPDVWIRRLIPKNPVLGIVAASLLGILFPICECGMVPAVRNLIRKGMPLHAASTFVLVGPILNPIVFWSTWMAFRNRPEMVWSRMGLAFAVALAAGLIVYRFIKTDVLKNEPGAAGKAGHPHSHEGQTVRAKLTNFMSHSVNEFFDMGKYLIFGALLVALLQTLVAQRDLLILGQGEGSSNLLMMVLGFVLSLCSTSDAFVAQSFITTFSSGSLIAFMVFGPMLNLKSLLMMLAVFKTRFVLLLAGLVACMVFAGTWGLEIWILK